MHLRLLTEKGTINFGGVSENGNVGNKVLERKVSHERELFSEPISATSVKIMGEIIALQALRTVKKYDLKIAQI